jgi:hypothetical protein
MNSIPCDIVLLPAPELAAKAVVASQQLQSQGTHFTLAPAGPFPHASLYMTQLQTDRLAAVQKLLAAIAASTPVQSLVATSYYQSKGYLDPNYQRTPELDTLQMAVVHAINPVRQGAMRENDKARLTDATGLAKENLETYGYVNVGELFRPHLTLTRFLDETPVDTAALLPAATEFSGQFTRLGLFEMGTNGTCVREIGSWELAGASGARA